MAINQILPKINRRDFIKFVFGTASAAAVSGALPLWPTTAIARPIAESARLALDYDYLVDPGFDFCPVLPSYRDFLSLNGLSKRKLKEVLGEERWRFEHLLKNPADWSVSEIKEWLDSHIEFDDMSPRNAAEYTEYGDGIRLYESLPFEDAMELNLNLVEGDCPGSNFCGVHFSGDVEELNNGLRSLGVNLHVTG
jgi:hypothetical protein